MNLEIINQAKIRVPRRFLFWWVAEFERWLRTKTKINLAAKTLCLVFLETSAAKKINLQFRGKNYATDVLSFEGMEPQSLGELVFCSKVIERQAQEHRHAYQFELGYMTVHGILHLLGYDHERNKKEAEKMYELQDAAFDFLMEKWQSRP